MNHLMLVGIQWSGKGTQARKILEAYPEYVLFETGAELRSIATMNTPLGKDIKKTLEAGILVKTEQIKDILIQFLASHQWHPILFDSVIRSKEQNDILSPLIGNFSVIFLELEEEKAIARLTGRRVDPVTNEVFPSDFEGKTNPKTGNALITRSDDTEASIRNRISWSIRDTLPLLGIWRQSGHTVYTIDASERVETVFREIPDVLSRIRSSENSHG